MPVTYETEEVGDKIAHLHYFTSSSDWYIIELDKGDADDEDSRIQHQAFGYAILNGDLEMSEYGYMSIEEIKQYAELDLHFAPKPMSQILSKKDSSYSSQEVVEPIVNAEISEWKEAIETLNMLIEMGGKKAEISEWNEAIETLNMLVEMEGTEEFAKGGSVKNEVYIEYLNKDKGFKKDRKEFKTYEDAVKWAQKNFENFNRDMINYI